MSKFEYGKIGVAAICYNEELLIKAWLDHLLESKHISSICIIDCGSTDNTTEIIEEYKKTGRVFLRKTNWDKNFSSLRNQSLSFLKQQAPDTVWAMWIDIDTFFNKNPDKMFGMLNNIPLFLYEEIRFPSIRIFSRDKSWGKENICCEHWSMLKLATLKNFSGNLHEQVSTKNSNVLFPTLGMTADTWLAHYDLPKLAKQAHVNNVSLATVMGAKKFRYLQIRKLVDSLSPSDPDPDTMSEKDIETFGRIKIQEEIAGNPLRAWNDGHSKYAEEVLF